jgi:hypothetical protein
LWRGGIRGEVVVVGRLATLWGATRHPRYRAIYLEGEHNEHRESKGKEVKMNVKKWYDKSAIWTLFGMIVGALITFYASNLFYQKGEADTRKKLLKSAVYECVLNMYPGLVKTFKDTSVYLDAGYPFLPLVNHSINELLANLPLFESVADTLKVELINVTWATKEAIDQFNMRLTSRNLCIVVAPSAVKPMNPLAAEFYQEKVEPTLKKFIDFIGKHEKELLL